MRKRKETVIVCSAHSDDFVIGAGGTIAKYTAEGKKVIAIIFTFGEKSLPWLKEHVAKKVREDETVGAEKIMDCETIFFDLREFKFAEDYKDKKMDKEILSLLKKAKPNKIFTHSGEDPHPDHRAINKITLELYQKLEKKPEVYVYSVWNPISFRTKYPSLYVDITKTFGKKLKALKAFRSQKVHVAYPLFLLLYRAIKNGIKIRKLFAEQFYRIK